MRSKAIFMALLAFAFGAQAVPVSPETVKAVARAWVQRGHGPFRSLAGVKVEGVTEFQTTDDVPFFAAKIAGGGTVFLSGDTAISPIIAFTSADTDFSKIDRASPLWALLNRDISVRARALNPEGPYLYAANQADRASANRREWAELEAEGADASPYVAGGGLLYGVAYAPARQAEPTDVRVPMLVKSQWSQGDVGSSPCYNYYTPNNYVCGCVATALGQVLLYNHGPTNDACRGLEFPLAEVKPNAHTISVDGVPQTATLAGGTYAWDDMPLVPANGATDEQRQNIGKLLSDCGIAVNMSYTEEASGATMLDQRKALLADFGYKQAVWYWPDKTDFDGTETDVLKNAMFANFDAGNAILLSIPGHAIVADGYGYEDETPFVHLNFGWGGYCDFWYNLPDMTKAGDEYTVVDGMNYNIFPDKGAMTAADSYGTVAILSGRVLDDDGWPVAGLTVTVTKADGGEVVAEPVTDERGIWSVVLEDEGVYNLRTITDDGQWLAEETDVSVYPPSGNDVGNSWGHDLQLVHPSVRFVVDGVSSAPYSTLDRAIAAARTAAKTATDPIVIEILDVTQLKNPTEIDFNCVLVATNDNPYASAIVRPYEDTCLIVTNGATFALSNVVFAESAEVPVEVRMGGRVSVAGTVDFGIPYDQTALVTADAAGFVLSGPIDLGFTLDCAVAQTEGLYFGFADCDFETASNAAARIVCANDRFGELRGEAVAVDGGIRLRWVDDATRVPLADAVGYYVGVGDVTNTRARIDRLFERFEAALADGTVGAARELVILRPGALSRPLTVGGNVTIRGEGNPVVDCSAMPGFTVTGTQTVSGITFSNYANANGLFLVEGGKLVLDGVAILDAKGTKADSGAVVVRDGAEAELIDGTVLSGCSASGSKLSIGKQKGYGGGVTVDAGGSLMLGDCTITNCWALNNGGGIYAAEGARVVLTNGVAVVCDNMSGPATSLKPDDLYVAGTNGTEIGTVGLPGEGSAVGVLYGVTGGVGNRVGDVFARILAEVSDTNLCEEAFFNDTSADRSAKADGADLKWQERPTQVGSSTDGSGMRVAVFNVEEGMTLYYRHVGPAFAEITGDSIVLLRTNDTFDADIEVKHDVVLTTDLGKTPVLAGIEREDNCSIVVGEGGSLTVEAAGVYGCTIDEGTGVPLFGTCTVPLIRVDGGSLTLDSESEVAFALGDGSISANAVTVRNGGMFTMREDALIYCCGNFHDRSSVECGFGGGLNVHGGTAYLEGGEIADCFAAVGGGAFIGGKSTVYVSGDVCITNNTTLDDAVTNNLAVSDNSQLVLKGVLTGAIGYVEGDQADTKVFGSVSAEFPGDEDVQASAHRFTHDVTGDIGMAVSHGSETVLVWGSALKPDGTFDWKDSTYGLADGAKARVSVPVAVEPPLVYTNGVAQVGVPEGIGYFITGNVATDAGNYTARATPRPGFAWAEPDGSTDATNIAWSIAKATYDLSKILFKDREFPYDGYEHALAIEGTLPEGLAVTYSANNLLRQPGTNEVTATISVAVPSENWMLVPDPTNLTAKLIVLPASGDDPTPPDPPQPKIVEPDPIAFTSIEKVNDKWVLVATNAKQWCWYSLWTGTTPKTNEFVMVEGSSNQWTFVDGPITNEVSVTDDSARFWTLRGAPGKKSAQ